MQLLYLDLGLDPAHYIDLEPALHSMGFSAESSDAFEGGIKPANPFYLHIWKPISSDANSLTHRIFES